MDFTPEPPYAIFTFYFIKKSKSVKMCVNIYFLLVMWVKTCWGDKEVKKKLWTQKEESWLQSVDYNQGIKEKDPSN